MCQFASLGSFVGETSYVTSPRFSFHLILFLYIYFMIRVWAIWLTCMREASGLSLGSLDHNPSFHPVLMWLLSMLWYGSTSTHIFFPFVAFISSLPLTLLFFITFFLFSPHSMFDYGLGIYILFMFILLTFDTSFLFHHCFIWDTPKSMIHEVFYALHLTHEGYVYYIIGLFGPIFSSFLHPITLT